MTRVSLLFALGVVSFVVCGCSDAISSASPFSEKKALCDLRPGTPQCTDIREFSGPSLTVFENVCNSLKSGKENATGYKEDATCPTAEMWGGCQSKSGDGSRQTNWFYKGDKYKTEADAKAACDSNTEWVGPQ